MNILPLKKILCAYNFNATSLKALEHARGLAAEFGAELCVVHVMGPLDPVLGIMSKDRFDEARSADAAREIRRTVDQIATAPVETRPIIKVGAAAAQILCAIRKEQPDMVVIATRSLTGWHHITSGSVAEEVTRHSVRPVLVVHATDAAATEAAATDAVEAAPFTVEATAAAQATATAAVPALGAEKTTPEPAVAASPGQNPRDVREADFPQHGTDAEKLQFLLNYAVLAPSNRNAQPWLWHLSGNTLELYADRARSLHVADPEDRELTIACGAALYNLRLAMRHFGYRGEVFPFPPLSAPDLLARVALGSRLQSANSSDSEQELFQNIGRRHTGGRLNETAEIPKMLRQQLKDAARSENAVLRFVGDDEARTVVDLVARGEIRQKHDPKFRAEMNIWLRPAGEGRTDGLASPGARAEEHRELAGGAPLLAILETEGDSRHDWLAAGQALEAILLRAASEGLQASYFNQPVESGALWRELRTQLGLRLHPQMLFRLGYVFPAPAAEPSPRRPVSEVLVLKEKCSGAEKDTATCSKCRNCRHEQAARENAALEHAARAGQLTAV